MNLKYVLCIFLFLTVVSVQAKDKEPLRHHIIIAVDKAGCDGWIGNAEVSQYVRKLLQSKLDSDIKFGRRYFEPGDYVSVVGFRINLDQSDMSVFAMPMKAGDGMMAYQQFSEDEWNSFLSDNWRETVLQSYNMGYGGFSLVSVAKEYALSALKSEGQQVGRTFMVMITDRHYNGNNFYDEMKAFEQKQAEMGANSSLTPQAIFKRCYEVQQYYFCRYISTGSIWGGNYFSPQGYVELYEYEPLQQNFTLGAAVGYPTHLRAVRQCDDSYIVELPLSWRNNAQYRLHQLETHFAEDNKFPNQSVGSVQYITSLSDTIIRMTIPAGSNANYVVLRAWLSLMDGFYNATLLSPTDGSSVQSGQEGLNMFIPIEREPDATVFGVRLASYAWAPLSWAGDQYFVAKCYEYAIYLIVLLAFLAFVGYKLTRPLSYHPGKGDFKLGTRNRQ